jgi:hypothetical protein
MINSVIPHFYLRYEELPKSSRSNLILELAWYYGQDVLQKVVAGRFSTFEYFLVPLLI